MIKNKYYIYGSLALFILCEALFFPYPNNHLFDARVTFLIFPLIDANGFIFIGIFGSIVFILSLTLVVLGVKKYYTLSVILTSVAFVVLPLLIISIIQQTFATGIYAISYDGAGECKIEEHSVDEVKGECFIKLMNHSAEKLDFRMELIDSFAPEEKARFESLFNLAGPIYITLLPNEEKTIHLEQSIVISNIKHPIGLGTSHNVHFKIIDGKNERIF